jgi:eukaryotic-like serine/threonine-protein kinase
MALEGSYIGRFHLERLLGRGGMGEVYLAEDDQLRRQVAIKVIQADYHDPDATRLFLREARAIAMLNHPHILPLFDFGEATIHGAILTYMVMPFCRDGTLVAWMQQHRNSALLSPQDVGDIIQQAANALQYAHNHQIVHQDVKPSNFLIRSYEDTSGRPDLMLADFGVAKSTSATATVSQTVRGTPAYMAPEQWDGTPVPATDQYALAILAYDLLTGHPPFQGSLGQVMYQHLHVTPPPPRTLNQRIPTDVDTVLLHALAKKPIERFGSISAFARAFEQALLAVDSGPTRASTLQEPNRSDIHAALVISEAEARAGTNRLLTLPGGQRVSATVPAGTQSGHVIRFEGQVEPASDRDAPGALILTITIAPPEEQARLTNAGDATAISSGSVAASNGAGEITPPPGASVSPEIGTRRRGLSRGTAILLVGLALLVVGGSVGFFYFARRNQQNPYAPFGTLAVTDALIDNGQGYGWYEYPTNSIGGACQFAGGAYHVSQSNAQYISFCNAKNTNFSNFAFEVQMRIIQGDCGGLIFRYQDSNNGTFYYFEICQNGTYTLFESYSNTLRDNASSTAIHTGLNQSNLIAVSANGSTLDLYVNNQKIDSINDSTHSQGQIGVVATDLNSPTEVVFSDAKVWTQ